LFSSNPSLKEIGLVWVNFATFIFSCCKLMESPQSCIPIFKPQLFYPFFPLTHLLGPTSLTLSYHLSDPKLRLVICAKLSLLSSKRYDIHYFFSKASLVHLHRWVKVRTLFLLVDLFVPIVVLGGVFSLSIIVCSYNPLCRLRGKLGIMGTLYFPALASNNLTMFNCDLQEVWNLAFYNYPKISKNRLILDTWRVHNFPKFH
jgi:hypothetical protein